MTLGYDIHIVDEGFHELGAMVHGATGARRAFLITNPIVGPLYGAAVSGSLASAGLSVEELELPEGEASKNLDTWRTLVEGLLVRAIDRRSVVVALGGGVVGDIAGFAAATVLRGVALVQVPTTLVSMVDSAVGGKTGVNGWQGKNQVGAFHAPRLVYTSLGTLATLPPEELRSGLGEVMKHALIRDADLFSLLEREPDSVLSRRVDVVRALVERSCRVKADIVGRDEREMGLRSLLNFGHTVGHALETAAGFGVLRHGECVALGILAETRWGARQGFCDPAIVPRIARVLQSLGMDDRAPPVERRALTQAAGIDKKVAHGMLDTAILERVGWARLERLEGADTVIAAMLDELR